jgi:ElaB/YqjD/DUF883 family membrane-anchored ribosome-binding protein
MDEKTDVLNNMEQPELRQLRDDMNRTKKEMEGTIHSMRERYSMERMKRRTQDAAQNLGQRASNLIQERGDDLKNTAGRIGQTVKENPIPFAAFGAGVGILAYGIYRSRSKEQDEWPEEYRIGGEVPEICGTEQYTPSGVYHYYESSSEEQGEGPEGSLKGRAGHLATEMSDRARRLGEKARYRSERVRNDFLGTVREHPFITGTAAFTIGILSGLLFPPTRQEDRYMGSASDAVKERAQEKKQDVLESAQRIAEQTKEAAKEAAKEEAEKQGFTRH